MSWRDKLVAWRQARKDVDSARQTTVDKESTEQALQTAAAQALAAELTSPARSSAQLPSYLEDRLREELVLEDRLTVAESLAELLDRAKLEHWGDMFPIPPLIEIPFGALWNRIQTANMSRITVGQAPGALGGLYHYFTAKNGDVSDVGGCRTEFVASRPEHIFTEGMVRRFQWKTVFPGGGRFPLQTLAANWLVFTQWHQKANGPTAEDPTGSPPIEFLVSRRRLRARLTGDRPDELTIWDAPIQLDREYSFDLLVGFSRDPTKGFVSLSVNGIVVCPTTLHRTMVDEECILKQGIYRNPAIIEDQTIGHREMKVSWQPA